MDFHSLSRRDLQSLCKKNRIPANMTNIAMADALQALQTVEGIGEIQEALQFQSPKKSELLSPELPRTGRRTSTRRQPTREEPKEGQASPLPRSRRVTAKASDIMRMVVDEGEEGEKQEGAKEVPETPKAPTTRRRSTKKAEGEKHEVPKKVAETLALNTRRREAKKEAKAEILDTPATLTGRRASARRVAEISKVEVEKEEKTVVSRTCRRTTRQSSRNETTAATEVAAVNNRRSTRARAAVKMVALSQEEEEEEEEEEKVVDGDASDEVSGVTVAESTDSLDQPPTEEEMKSVEITSDPSSEDLVVETHGSSETLHLNHPTMDSGDKIEEEQEKGK